MKLLFVDDNIDILNLVKVILKKTEFELLTVQSAKKALEILTQHQVDLIILDIMMPEMDGYELCQILKESPETKSIPVIFLTAQNDTNSVVKGLKLGAVDFLSKPFHKDEFIARINVHLNLHKSNQSLSTQLEEKKQLAHILCHDLKNPIGGAQSFLNLAMEYPDESVEMLGYVSDAINQGLDIIELVRSMMALDEGNAKLTIVTYSLVELIDDSLQILKQKISDKNIKIILDIPEDTQVSVERVSFVNSVLNNMLTNAFKFSYPGDLLKISAKKINSNVELKIQDYGIGMPNSLVQDLFDVKIATSRIGTDGETGTGFGMPLMKKFIEQYGGSLTVNSIEKKEGVDIHGTTICILLKSEGDESLHKH